MHSFRYVVLWLFLKFTSQSMESNSDLLTDPLTSLPCEIQLKIYSFVPLKDVLHLREVNCALSRLLYPTYEMIGSLSAPSEFWSFYNVNARFEFFGKNWLDFSMKKSEPTARSLLKWLFGERYEEMKAYIRKSYKKVSLSIVNKDSILIPTDIGALQNLQIIFLKELNIHFLPEEISDLSRKLKFFSCTNTMLRELPSSFCQLKNLKNLELKNNRLYELPAGFGNLKLLKKLILCNNNLHALTEEIGGCCNLEILDLSGNNIGKLPNSLGNCYKLTHLNVSMNKIYTLNNINMKAWKKLKVLTLADNYLNEFPKSVINCKRLKFINLEKNQFSKIPYELSKLTILFSLIMDYNPLVGQLDQLGYVKLKHLSLKGCFNINPEIDRSVFPKLNHLFLEEGLLLRHSGVREKLQERGIVIIELSN